MFGVQLPESGFGGERDRATVASRREERTMLGTVLLIILILLLIGALPRWGYSTGWGYYPSGRIAVEAVGRLQTLLITGTRDCPAGTPKAFAPFPSSTIEYVNGD
jgi:hypothetical protein